MITNEQRAHEIALALMAQNVQTGDPIKAYQIYINYLVPILKQFDKDFPHGIAEHLNGQSSSEATSH